MFLDSLFNVIQVALNAGVLSSLLINRISNIGCEFEALLETANILRIGQVTKAIVHGEHIRCHLIAGNSLLARILESALRGGARFQNFESCLNLVVVFSDAGARYFQFFVPFFILWGGLSLDYADSINRGSAAQQSMLLLPNLDRHQQPLPSLPSKDGRKCHLP
jgi:hypothetical protein